MLLHLEELTDKKYINMNAIVVEKALDIVSVDYNGESKRFDQYARNMTTGHKLARLANDKGIETSMLCNSDIQYAHDMFDTVGGIVIDSNQKLFDELKKML